MITILIVIIVVLLIILAFVVGIASIKIKNLNNQIIELNESHARGLKSQSGEVAGKILEKLLPFFIEYPYDTRDIIPIYDTFDFIVLNGRCNENITEVIIQDVKTGQSELSKRQQQIRDCVERGAVKFETWKRSNKTEHFYLAKRLFKRDINDG